jgi:hypothetical protein
MTDPATAASSTPAPAAPAPIAPAGRQSSPTPIAPVRLARAADPAPSRPTTASEPRSVEPSALERFQMSPEQRRQLDLNELAAFDPHRDPSRPVLRDKSGRVVGPDGRLVDGGNAEPPGEQPVAPTEPAVAPTDKPKIRVGDSVNGFEATEDGGRGRAVASREYPSGRFFVSGNLARFLEAARSIQGLQCRHQSSRVLASARVCASTWSRPGRILRIVSALRDARGRHGAIIGPREKQ